MTFVDGASRKISAVVADDHSIVRAGVKTLLAELGDIELLGEAANGLETIAVVKARQPDILVLDINMPYANGMEVVSEVRRWSKETRIAVFSGISSAQIFSDLIAAGVSAILLKKDDPDVVSCGLTALKEGKSYFSQAVLDIMKSADASISLSAREHQILNHIAVGESNNAIAKTLSISPKTVDNHRSNLMRKLDAHSVIELIRIARDNELLDNAEL